MNEASDSGIADGGSSSSQPSGVNAPPLSAGWKITKSAEGRAYYYNTTTKQTTWKRPRPDAEDSAQLPLGWSSAKAADGRVYYYALGEEARWTRPTAPAIRSLSLPPNQPKPYDTHTATLDRLQPDNAEQSIGASLPRPGSTVSAIYNRTWKPARVVSANPGTRALTVQFYGWLDQVVVAEGRWDAVTRGTAAPSSRTKCARSEDSDSVAGHAGESELSAEERAMLQRCAAIRGDVEGKEDSSAIPGAPLDSANVGHRLLRAMGWTPGEGLGVRQEGRLQSVAEELVVQHSRAGLRAVHEQPKSHAKSHGSGQNNRTASSVAFSSRTCV